MVAKKFGFVVIVAVAILATVPLASAQGFGTFGSNTGATCGAACDPCGQGFCMGLGVRKYINSFTSYQISANPTLTVPTGKTRVEWPWDQLYGVVKLSYNRGCVGIVLDYSAPFDSHAGIKAQETYWDAGDGTVTLFGKAKGKPRGQLIDIAATWCLPLSTNSCEEPTVQVSAVAGYRNHRYGFSMTGLTDSDESGNPPTTYPGVVAEFAQYYHHWYIGGILTKCFDLGSVFGSSSCSPGFPLVVSFQADYAWVKGNNNYADYVHWVWVQTTPALWTSLQETTGSSWHLNLTVSWCVSSTMKMAVEGDFKRIDTRGNEHFIAPVIAPAGADWNGAKAWSDQQYLGFIGTYCF
jgi:hypothetical protein